MGPRVFRHWPAVLGIPTVRFAKRLTHMSCQRRQKGKEREDSACGRYSTGSRVLEGGHKPDLRGISGDPFRPLKRGECRGLFLITDPFSHHRPPFSLPPPILVTSLPLFLSPIPFLTTTPFLATSPTPFLTTPWAILQFIPIFRPNLYSSPLSFRMAKRTLEFCLIYFRSVGPLSAKFSNTSTWYATYKDY